MSVVIDEVAGGTWSTVNIALMQLRDNELAQACIVQPSTSSELQWSKGCELHTIRAVPAVPAIMLLNACTCLTMGLKQWYTAMTCCKMYMVQLKHIGLHGKCLYTA